MPNMGYCRFENTERDLRDCLNHLDDQLTGEEHEARKRLIRLCKEIHETAQLWREEEE